MQRLVSAAERRLQRGRAQIRGERFSLSIHWTADRLPCIAQQRVRGTLNRWEANWWDSEDSGAPLGHAWSCQVRSWLWNGVARMRLPVA
jgi:hypothetical protein